MEMMVSCLIKFVIFILLCIPVIYLGYRINARSNKERLLLARRLLSCDWVDSYYQRSPFWRFEPGMQWWIQTRTWFGEKHLSCLIEVDPTSDPELKKWTFKIVIAYKYRRYDSELIVDQKNDPYAELINTSGDRYVDLNRIILIHSIDTILKLKRSHW